MKRPKPKDRRWRKVEAWGGFQNDRLDVRSIEESKGDVVSYLYDDVRRVEVRWPERAREEGK